MSPCGTLGGRAPTRPAIDPPGGLAPARRHAGRRVRPSSAPLRPPPRPIRSSTPSSERTFHFFWDSAKPAQRAGAGPLADERRSPASPRSGSASPPIRSASSAATSRASRRASARSLTLRFFWNAPQGAGPSGVDRPPRLLLPLPRHGDRPPVREASSSPPSTPRCCSPARSPPAAYFDGDDPAEAGDPRAGRRAVPPRRLGLGAARAAAGQHGLAARRSGFIAVYDWQGYDEAMLLYVLALGSPTHPIRRRRVAGVDAAPTSGASFYGQEHVNFAPLFGHQYSHVWIDFRGIQDAYMRGKGIDYFENSRRATLSQRAYAIANPARWQGYGADVWGLTASDGPLDATHRRSTASTRTFHTYWARGAAADDIRDDGTIAPTAAGGSIPFAPEVRSPRCRRHARPLRRRRCSHATASSTRSTPRFADAGPRSQHGRIVPGRGLVRHRLPRHRPGADRAHDREPPQRPRLAPDAEEPARGARPVPRRVQRRWLEGRCRP